MPFPDLLKLPNDDEADAAGYVRVDGFMARTNVRAAISPVPAIVRSTVPDL
jgi:hypothetical protein